LKKLALDPGSQPCAIGTVLLRCGSKPDNSIVAGVRLL
jgi:hypothetical protein